MKPFMPFLYFQGEERRAGPSCHALLASRGWSVFTSLLSSWRRAGAVGAGLGKSRKVYGEGGVGGEGPGEFCQERGRQSWAVTWPWTRGDANPGLGMDPGTLMAALRCAGGMYVLLEGGQSVRKGRESRSGRFNVPNPMIGLMRGSRRIRVRWWRVACSLC